MNSIEKTIRSFQFQCMFGLMLGDGCLRNPNSKRRSTGNYRLEFTFKAPVLNYMCWLKFDVLGSLCTKTLPTPYPKEGATQYWFCTKSLKILTQMQKHWYTCHKETGRRIKVLPNRQYFKTFFTEVSLAHWIIGDGYWEKDGQTLFLCTECFTFEEVTFLVQMLQDLFQLKAGLKRRIIQGNLTGYRIRFSMATENLKKLRNLTIPYMHPSMLYKLGK